MNDIDKATKELAAFFEEAARQELEVGEIAGILYGQAFTLVEDHHGRRKALKWALCMAETSLGKVKADAATEEAIERMRH